VLSSNCQSLDMGMLHQRVVVQCFSGLWSISGLGGVRQVGQVQAT